MNIVPTIAELVQHFRPAFAKPAFAKFAYIALAWAVCERRPAITNFIRAHLPNIPDLSTPSKQSHRQTLAVQDEDPAGR